MGQQNTTSQKLFEQYKSKPSNRARDQIWALYHDPNNVDLLRFEGSDDVNLDDSEFIEEKEFLTYNQSEEFLSDLHDFLKKIDRNRDRGLRTWENKEYILHQWLLAYGSALPSHKERLKKKSEEIEFLGEGIFSFHAHLYYHYLKQRTLTFR